MASLPAFIAKIKGQTMRGRALALIWLPLVLVAGCEIVDDNGPNATFGNTVRFNETTSPTWRRVFEDGVRVSFELTVSGYKDREVPLRLFTADGKVLGERTIIPRYEATYWEQIGLFVPHARLQGAGSRPEAQVFVVSPDDPATYIGSVRFAFPEGLTRDVVWEGKSWTLDDLIDGQLGFSVIADLTLYGQAGRSSEALLFILNEDGDEIPDDLGGPIRGSRVRLGPPTGDVGYYEKLRFSIPYQRLSHLPPSQLLQAAPAWRRPSGDWQVGNIHFLFWAGGTLGRQENIVRDEIGRLEREADDIQRRIDALGSGASP